MALAIPVVAQQEDPRPSVEGSRAALVVTVEETRSTLSLAGMNAFHTTTNLVQDQRVVDVAGSTVRVALWSEVLPDGRTVPFYAISLDGQTMATVRQTSYELKLRHGEFDPGAGVLPVQASLSADETTGLYIVQFVTQPLEAYRSTIRDLGGTVYQFLAQHAHIVKMTPQVRESVAALPYVRWIGAFHPAYRLEEFMLDNEAQSAELYPLLAYNIMVFESGMGQKRTVANRISALGGTVEQLDAGKYLLVATLTPAQLFEVARWNEVLFIDRWGALEEDMNNARIAGGANHIETVAGYTGTGVRGESFDSGFNVNHVDFASRPLIIHGTAGSASHGASTSGICFGDGTGDPNARGLLPSAQGIVSNYGGPGLTGPARYTHTGELLQAPYYGVFQTSSVGSPRTANYTTISADTDAYLFDFDIVHCQSQSNAGDTQSRPQAWAKNIISGGGVRHYDTLTTTDDCWCGGGSTGPATDGRIKPDLCAYYDNIRTVTGGGTTAYTNTFGGTSGATPIICGHVGLFFEMWADEAFGNVVPFPPGTGPSGYDVFDNKAHMTTAKAALINSATQYAFSGTSHDLTRVHQGWGWPDVGRLYDMRDGLFIVDETEILTNLDVATFTVGVSAGEPVLKVTLVYADPPGNPSSSQHRINDLTLKVTSPSNVVYWGNNGLLAGNWSTPGGSANVVDTVENVFVENPEPGAWLIEVFADEIVQDSHIETPQLDADFALVVTGVIPAALQIHFPNGIPERTAPGTPTDIDVEVFTGSEDLVPGSATLHYRLSPGAAFTAVPLTEVTPFNFIATIPAADCGEVPEFYLSAQGTGGTTVVEPQDAPAVILSMRVEVEDVFFADDFESDQGWTVVNDVSMTNGVGGWERGVPVNCNRGDPPVDADGFGQCYLTDNRDIPTCNTDVDFGPTMMTSPVIDLSGAVDPTLSYARWFTVDPIDQDRLDIEISSDDGATWTLLESATSRDEWIYQSVRVRNYIALTSTVRLRFTTEDNPNNSITEAAADAIKISEVVCGGALSCLKADVNNDGVIAGDDIDRFVQIMFDGGGMPQEICAGDLNAAPNGEIDPSDVDEFVQCLLQGWCP